MPDKIDNSKNIPYNVNREQETYYMKTEKTEINLKRILYSAV